MLSYLIPVLVGAVVGTFFTGLTLFLYYRRHRLSEPPATEPADPWVEAEIDRAAVEWAMEHGRPEAANLIANKLRLLHRIGSERGR